VIVRKDGDESETRRRAAEAAARGRRASDAERDAARRLPQEASGGPERVRRPARPTQQAQTEVVFGFASQS